MNNNIDTCIYWRYHQNIYAGVFYEKNPSLSNIRLYLHCSIWYTFPLFLWLVGWEHMKLVFFPVLIWSFFITGSGSKLSPALRPALLLGGFIGTLMIPVLFYTYSGILGHNVTGIDIAIFFVNAFLAFFCAWRLQNSRIIYQKRTVIYILTVLFLVLFILFTFLPPDIGLFAEP